MSNKKSVDSTGDDLLLRYKSIVESANDAIISINEKGRIIFWNDAATKMLGWDADQLLGDTLDRIIPSQFKELHNAGIKRVNEGGEHHVIGKTAELIAIRKDGVEIPIELSLSTWVGKTGRFYGGIIRDITERKEAETALETAANQFRSITDTANDAIISANQLGLITSWNLTAQKIFGYKEEEVLGKPLEIIIPENFREGHAKGIKRVVGGGDRHVIGHTAELQGLRKDGSVFPLELSLSTWNADGEMHFCGIVRDITERKSHEEALKKSRESLKEKAQKLKEANYNIKQKSDQLQSLSQKLAKYLSKQVYNSIFEGERDVKIESYRKKLTVFFSDIQGFTEMSDRVESEVLTSLLNSYLNEMSKIAMDCGGTLDKFIGDAIMIFFGDPDSAGVKQDALICVKMALKMRERLKSLHKEWELLGIALPLNVRMGINTGYCTVGNFGSEERMDYTIVGSQVNLASRLESLAETNQILISQDTYLLVKDEIACIPREEVRVKGLAYAVQTYQVVDLIENLDHRRSQIISQLSGFEIKLDPESMVDEEKKKVMAILEKAMDLLEK